MKDYLHIGKIGCTQSIFVGFPKKSFFTMMFSKFLASRVRQGCNQLFLVAYYCISLKEFGWSISKFYLFNQSPLSPINLFADIEE
jgi:hypothetical protein